MACFCHLLFICFVNRKARESLLDFYLIITKYQQLSDIAVTSAMENLSSLSVGKATNQTEMSDSTSFCADKSNQSSSKPDEPLVKQDQSLLKPDQASVKPDQASAKPDKVLVKPDQSLVKSDQSSVTVEQSSDQSAKADQPSIKQSVIPELIRPDQFVIKSDQATYQTSQLMTTTTTLDTPPNHPTVVMVTKSHQDSINSSNIMGTPVDQLPSPIYGKPVNRSVTL